MCNILKPMRILDLGSGFSSFTFNFYKKNTTSKPEIWSVDDSAEWLEKTNDFLTGNKISINNLMTWDSFSKKDWEPFDFILHDLGRMDVRMKVFEKVISYAKPGGIIVLDDVHKKDYMSFVKQKLKQMNLNYYNLESFTMDKFKRFAILVIA
jgi:predicted O-methyltransferase YrrM